MWQRAPEVAATTTRLSLIKFEHSVWNMAGRFFKAWWGESGERKKTEIESSQKVLVMRTRTALISHTNGLSQSRKLAERSSYAQTNRTDLTHKWCLSQSRKLAERSSYAQTNALISQINSVHLRVESSQSVLAMRKRTAYKSRRLITSQRKREREKERERERRDYLCRRDTWQRNDQIGHNASPLREWSGVILRGFVLKKRKVWDLMKKNRWGHMADEMGEQEREESWLNESWTYENRLNESKVWKAEWEQNGWEERRLNEQNRWMTAKN